MISSDAALPPFSLSMHAPSILNGLRVGRGGHSWTIAALERWRTKIAALFVFTKSLNLFYFLDRQRKILKSLEAIPIVKPSSSIAINATSCPFVRLIWDEGGSAKTVKKWKIPCVSFKSLFSIMLGNFFILNGFFSVERQGEKNRQNVGDLGIQKFLIGCTSVLFQRFRLLSNKHQHADALYITEKSALFLPSPTSKN